VAGCALLGCRSASERPAFDAARAFVLLEKQTQFGPRVSGRPGHDACLTFLADTLRAATPHVRLQEFAGTVSGEEHRLTNLIASFRPELHDRVLLCAHWDTRPWADQDPDSTKHAQPILGADDGASGVAVLLEIARQLSRKPPPVGVDIALFDGEDLGSEAAPQLFSQGAQAFARERAAHRPRVAIVLDMVGDKDLSLSIERNSWDSAPRVVRDIWAFGQRWYHDVYSDEVGYDLLDDHVPLIRAGIPAIDIIDFRYPYWHTLADTPDKCSPQSLEAVGVPVLAYVYGLTAS
jgi:hypothetical protein